MSDALGSGTLYVLDPRDDEDFCHEAWFKPFIMRLGAGVRVSFVFRWLSKCHRFFGEGQEGVPPFGLLPTPVLIEAAERREREREEKREGERRGEGRERGACAGAVCAPLARVYSCARALTLERIPYTIGCIERLV